MSNFFKMTFSKLVVVGVSFLLTSCQFGFMALDSEKEVKKEALTFANDPNQLPVELAVSFDLLKINQGTSGGPRIKKTRFGLCEQIQIIVANRYSVQVPLRTKIKVDLTSNGSSSNEFFFDAACTQAISSTNPLYLNSGEASKVVYFKASSFNYSPGASNLISVAANNPSFSSSPAQVQVKRIATQLTFDGNPTLPTSLNVGVCSGPITVSARDGGGNQFSEDVKTVSLASAGAGSFSTSSSCATTITAVTLTPSSPSVIVYFRVTSVVTSAVLSANTPGNSTTPSLRRNLTLGVTHTATNLTFDGNPNLPTGLNVGVCSGSFFVTVRDGLGSSFSEAASRTIALSSSSGSFYTSSNCASGSLVTSVTLGANVTSTTLYFRVTSIVNSAALTASSNNPVPLASANYTISNITHTATNLTFDGNPNLPAGLNVGVCSGGFFVTVRDGLGSPFSEAASRTIALSSSSGSFYTSSNCASGSLVTSVTLGANVTSTTLYFRVTSIVNSAALTASSNNPVLLASANYTIPNITHTPTKLAFKGNPNLPTSLNVGECLTLSVAVLDGIGGEYNNAQRTVNLDSGGVGSFFSSSNDCLNEINPILTGIQINSSSTSVSVYFKATSLTATSVTLDASSSPLSSDQLSIILQRFAFDTTFGSQGKVVDTSAGEVLALAKHAQGYVVAGVVSNRGFVKLLGFNGNVLASYTEAVSGVSSSKINALVVEGNDIYFVGSATTNKSNWIIGKLTYQGSGFNLAFNDQILPTSSNADSAIGIESINPTQVAIIGDRFEVGICNKSTGACNCQQINAQDPNVCDSAVVAPPSGVTNIAKKTAKVGSEIWAVGSSNSQLAVMKFNPTNLATVTTPTPFLGGSGIANSLVLDTNNTVLVTGGFQNQVVVMRFDLNLAVLQTFQDNVSTQGRDIAVEPSGGSNNILIAGTSSNQMLIRRYQPNGAFINGANIPNSSNANRLIKDGYKIVLGGTDGSNPAAVRIHP